MSYVTLVTTYNDKDLLPHCLKAVGSQSIPARQILIIDDGSTDGTPHRENMHRITAPKYPEGYRNRARAFNTGIKMLRGSATYVLKVDSDTLPHPDYAETLLRNMGPRTGVASGVHENQQKQKHWISNAATMYRLDALVEAPQIYGWDRAVALDIIRKGYTYKVIHDARYAELRPPRVTRPPLHRMLLNILEIWWLTVKNKCIINNL